MASIARVVAATVTFVASVACAGPGTQAAPLGSVGPVVGTSEITYSLSSFAPTSVTEAIGQYRVTSRWAISDASHWRLDSHTLQPALQRHAETVVANGSSLTWYTSLYHTAWSIPQPSGATLGVLGMWEAGALASAIQGLVPPYFAHLESLGLHVRRLGSEVILGQVADAFEVSPLYRDAGRPYGRATLWLDSDYPLVLRLEMRGLKHSLGDPVHWVYRVTSITFGQGPSTEDLAYHPPVPATPPPTTFSGEGSSQGGRGVRWLVPAGFIPVGTPSAYVLSGTESEQDPAAGGTSEIAALFWHASTFLDVEEQLRFLALPASLKRGARVRAGACWIRSGHLRHSNLYWLALRRSHVALEILSNHLNQAQLTAYAGSEICR